ncbi:MAG: DUF433 domain-containing protein [Chroococcidiopsidaceae cyanobacterium CP_BM_RX_35]|nr:DUF433 domain-containing protein [Chroococcidiopsidaceae cyanobacterium CP_BM_RX_35]
MFTTTDIGTLIALLPESGNRPLIAGTRTSVRRVVVLYKQGAGAEEIARRMPHLSLAQVYAALAYYHANRDEIEADLVEEETEYSKLLALHGKRAE